MAQTVAPIGFAQRIKWNERIKPALIVLVVAAIAYAVGAFVMAPRTALQQPTHLPTAFAALPTGSVHFVHADGTSALLPVRIADTVQARGAGFKDVGEQALDNVFLLYALPRETTARTSYVTEGFRAPVEFAAIDASGTVVSITAAPVSATRASIAERHQWLLAAKAGKLERFGVAVGSQLDPERIRRF